MAFSVDVRRCSRSRRTIPLAGEVNESSYEAGRYHIGGNDVTEQLTNLQRNVFAFVADFDKEVTVTFTVEAGPEGAVDNVNVSGIAKFVGIPLQNAESLAAKKKAGVKTESVVMTGKFQEVGMGWFYSGEENFSAQAFAAVYRCIDDYAKTRTFVNVNLDLKIEASGGAATPPQAGWPVFRSRLVCATDPGPWHRESAPCAFSLLAAMWVLLYFRSWIGIRSAIGRSRIRQVGLPLPGERRRLCGR